MTNNVKEILNNEKNYQIFKDSISKAYEITKSTKLHSVLIFYVSIFNTFEVEEAYFREYFEASKWLNSKVEEKKGNVQYYSCILDGEIKAHS